MANNVDDFYSKIAEASVTGGGNRIADGNYLFGIEALKMHNGHNGVTFIAEFRVLEASDQVVPDTERDTGEIGKEIKANAVGSKCSMALNLSHATTGKSAMGNAKAFLLALDGTSEEAVAANPQAFVSMMKAACSGGQPLTGAVIKCSTFRKKIRAPSKPDKTWFVGLGWTHVPQTAAEITARRAAWAAEAKGAAGGAVQTNDIPF